jgi:hypothetical protein
MLAFLFATKQYRFYLYGSKFTVYTEHRALKWLLNLQDSISRLNRWAVKLSEYDYVVENRPGTRMRHADDLSRNINWRGKDINLSRDVLKEEQEKDNQCLEYKHYENFWVDEDGILCNQEVKGQHRIVIPETLVHTVLIIMNYLLLRIREYKGQ